MSTSKFLKNLNSLHHLLKFGVASFQVSHTYHPCMAYLPTFAEFLLVHVGKCRYTVNSRWIQRGIKINSPHQWCISAWICQQKWLEKGRHIPQIKWGDLVVMIYHGEKDNNHITQTDSMISLKQTNYAQQLR